jgi:hypothetical protein
VFRLERQPDMPQPAHGAEPRDGAHLAARGAAPARTADQRGSEILGAPGTIAR